MRCICFGLFSYCYILPLLNSLNVIPCLISLFHFFYLFLFFLVFFPLIATFARICPVAVAADVRSLNLTWDAAERTKHMQTIEKKVAQKIRGSPRYSDFIHWNPSNMCINRRCGATANNLQYSSRWAESREQRGRKTHKQWHAYGEYVNRNLDCFELDIPIPGRELKAHNSLTRHIVPLNHSFGSSSSIIYHILYMFMRKLHISIELVIFQTRKELQCNFSSISNLLIFILAL